MLKELGLNNFKERRDFLLAVLMFKCNQGMAPTYLTDKLDLHSEINIRPSRHTDESTYNIPRTRTEKAKDAFVVQGPTVWNRIPSQIRAEATIERFKKSYKKELLGMDMAPQLLHLDVSTSTRPN